MKTVVERRNDRWVVLLKGTPYSNFATEDEAIAEAGHLEMKVPVGKMTWNDFKKVEGIDHIRED